MSLRSQISKRLIFVYLLDGIGSGVPKSPNALNKQKNAT